MDNPKKVSVSERLKQIMKERNLKQADILRMAAPICERNGEKIGSNALSEWITGKYEPNSKKLAILGQVLGVSEAWLRGYDVPMNSYTPMEQRTKMDDISQNLCAAIKGSGLTHRQLEEMTGIPHSAIQRYASGTTKNVPSSRLKVLSDALGISVTSLMGDSESTTKDISTHSTDIYKRIREIRIKRGLSQAELASKVGYQGRSSISKVEQGERDISQSMIEKYAKALGVTMTYLLYGDSRNDVSLSNEEIQNEEYILLFSQLKQEHKEMINAQIKGILATYKKED